MKKEFLILVFAFVAAITYGQDKVYLNNGQVFEGKITQNNDSLVVLKLNSSLEELQNIMFSKAKVWKIKLGTDTKNDYVTFKLVNGKIVKGRIVVEREDSITIGEIKGSKFGTLSIAKNQIVSINKKTSKADKPFYLDIGVLRGAALIGAELELPSGQNSSIYIGGGLKGYASGLNIFFRENYVGPGIKVSYLHLGIGDSFAGSLLSGGFFIKMRPGLSVELGLGKVLRENRYAFKGYKWLLTYGVGIRF